MKFRVFLAFALTLCIPAAVSAEDRLGVTSQQPSASPTGRDIVFVADFDGPTRLWKSGLDGSGLRKLSSLSDPSTARADMAPSWSPDAQWIAYASSLNGASDIWIVKSDGTYPQRLTSNGFKNSQPTWSPDGTRIVFISDKDGTKDIWVMNANGTQPAKLLTSSAEENSPHFSPGGDQIVFSRTDGDVGNIMAINANGSGLRSITNGAFRDWEPHWGTRGIVFSSNRDPQSENWKIWMVGADGSGLRKAGDTVGHDPKWLPDGRLIFTDESARTKAQAHISVIDPVTGVKQIAVDVQGYFAAIDVRPGKTSNHVNPRSAGRVQIAVLSTPIFDATKEVIQSTLTFGRTGSEPSISTCAKVSRDVNGDGIPDLVCRFVSRAAGFVAGSSTGVLRFSDVRRKPFEGRDTITIVSEEDPDDFRD